MKLSAAAAKRFFESPDVSRAGFLVYGPDPLLVAHGRDRIVKALLRTGSGTAFERAAAEQLGRNRDCLAVMIKAQGFFADRRVVCVDGAGDGAAEAASRALAARGQDDGWLLLTAGRLRPASKIRKLFETSDNAVAAPIYDASLSTQEVRGALETAGLRSIDAAAMEDLSALGRNLAPQMFIQTVEKLALYKRGDDSPVQSAEVEACAPREEDGSLDELLSHVLEKRTAKIGPALRQVYSQGQNPVTVLIRAQREFCSIFYAASDPAGPASGVARLRPPVFGLRRSRMIKHVSHWGEHGAEAAVCHLISADRLVRSDSRTPARAVVERVLMRLSLLRTT